MAAKVAPRSISQTAARSTLRTARHDRRIRVRMASSAPPSSSGAIVRRWNDLCGDRHKHLLVDPADQIAQDFAEPMAFGTAGLRAEEGVGWSRMNDITVALSCQGLCEYLQEGQTGPLTVVIGFDGRRGSRQFADAAAAAFVFGGISALVFDAEVPTPLVSYAVRSRGAAAGVVITASHNPKTFNGLKVFWSNGCQIIPPHDTGIAACIDRQTHVWDEPRAGADPAASLETLPSEAEAALWCNAVAARWCTGNASSPSSSSASAPDRLDVVYTPLHGVGAPFVAAMFDAFGLPPFHPVPAQMAPDASFPTVTFPNPEEGDDVWDLSFAQADAVGAHVCLANDPDADRFCAAERDASEVGGWRVFSGNDIGLLLADWCWRTQGKAMQTESPEREVAMLSTAVSSRMLQSMARAEGFRFEETLTGFKWLSHRSLDLEEEGAHVLFAYEEAIGYMFGGNGVLDKDGVTAAAVFMELVREVYGAGNTLTHTLDQLQTRYGRRQYLQGYFRIDDTMRPPPEIFETLRESFPDDVGGMAVRSVRDMGTGLDTAEGDGRTRLPWREGDLMVTLRFDEDGFCCLRASGTEPKLKYYIDLAGGAGDPEDVKAWIVSLTKP